jgi:FolB domain-containing protein
MKITINGIELQAVVGTKEHERNSHQNLQLNIEFSYDASEAVRGDKIESAVDYSEIVRLSIQTAKESRCFLIETLAEKIISVLRSFGRIDSAMVEVKKFSAVKNIGFVSATANFERIK